MHGTFLWNDNGPGGGGLREKVLRAVRWAGEPESLTTFEADAEELGARAGAVRRALQGQGAVKIRLGRTLSNEEFLGFGSALGLLIPETAGAVRRYVEDEFILSVRQERAETDDVDMQPFAENYITLHSEMSTLPATEQPRFIALMCESAPEPDTGGQTLLVPMRGVYEQLPPADRDILRRTRYERGAGGQDVPPPFLYSREGRPVFSFRDFNREPLKWTHGPAGGDGPTPERVNEALRRLLTAMYDPARVRGARWERGVLLVIDNTFFFHGKSYYRGGATGSPRRLKRLRILADSRAGSGGCPP